MSIKVAPNPTYVNGTTAFDKYNPIAQPVVLNRSDRAVLAQLLTNRIEALKYAGYPSLSLNLQLTVKDKKKLFDNSRGKAPPFVVVSSRRAAWIQSGFIHCDAIARSLATKRQAAIAGIMDLRPLWWRVNDRITDARPSPPIYCPTRLGPSANRNVYIVVHLNEYATYCNALARYPTVTVVGWNFRGLPRYGSIADIRQPPSLYSTLAGFGASRFAAIEFTKRLLHGGSTTVAWHFDDNVVALSNTFRGLKAYEDNLTGVPCQGFAGLPVSYGSEWIRDWTRTGKDPRKTPGDAPTSPIFQQAVLWNILYLNNTNTNFGLTYVASAEDVSLSKYFAAKATGWRFDNTVAILKEIASDGPVDQGAENLGKAKSQFEEIFATIESLDLPGQPATRVAVQVDPRRTTKIRDFISGYVTKGYEDRIGLRDRAACQAAEEITKTAIGLKLVTDAADTTFTKMRVTTEFRDAG